MPGIDSFVQECVLNYAPGGEKLAKNVIITLLFSPQAVDGRVAEGPVKLTPEISLHGSYKPSFEILFEPTWGSQEQWRDVIEAFTR